MRIFAGPPLARGCRCSAAHYEEVIARFSKCGVIEEDDEGEPKVKMYAKDDGSFSGDALIVYFKEESVALAVAMLDDAELRIGDDKTRMNVSQAQFSHKETHSHQNGESKPRKVVDKKKVSKRLGRMQKYVLPLSIRFLTNGKCL